jgi:hypothetical protein
MATKKTTATATATTVATAEPTADEKPKVLKYKCENKTLVHTIKDLANQQAGIIAKRDSLDKLIGESAEAIGLEYTGPFEAWCTRNSEKHTYAAFLKYTVDPNFPQKRGDKATNEAGYSFCPSAPLYWVMSTAMQKFNKLRAVSERTIKVKATIHDLVAKGMAEAEAEKQAEATVPAVSGTARTAEVAGVDTPLKIYQKGFAAVIAAVSPTPRDTATTVLQSFGLADSSIKPFLDNVLPKQSGAPAVKQLLDAYALRYVAEHVEVVVGILEKSGYVVAQQVQPKTPAAQAELVAAGMPQTTARKRVRRSTVTTAATLLLPLLAGFASLAHFAF